jgi:hypothetical protein
MTRAAWPLALALAGAGVMVAPLPAEAGVRKCTDAQGRVTYRDSHCPGDGEVGAAPTRNAAASAGTTHGAWRGPAQFQFVHSAGASAPGPSAPLALEMRPDGRVSGEVAGAGCRIEGVHTPYVADRIVAVEIVISGCHDARFNARYAGQLNARDPARGSRLGLHAIGGAAADRTRPLHLATIDALLQR